jgi:hypothetical protein
VFRLFHFNFAFLNDFTATPVKSTGSGTPNFLAISQQKAGKRVFNEK